MASNQSNNGDAAPVSAAEISSDTKQSSQILQAQTASTSKPLVEMKMETAGESPRGTAGNLQLDSRPLGVNIHTRPMGAHSVREGAVSIREMATIAEPTWDLVKMVERPQVVGSYAWATTRSSHYSLAALNIPTDIYASSKFFSMPFQNFLYWRGDIELHLQVNGTPFHQGTVIMYYLPLVGTGSANYSVVNANFSSITSLQHVVLHANSATSACMTIPFINPRFYNTLTNSANGSTANCNGLVGITVFNPLKVASGGATTVSVSLIAQFKNSQFKVPVPIAPPAALFGEGILERMLGEKPGNLIQRMLPRNVIADTINTVTSFMGLDKPTSIERSPPMKMLGTQYANSAIEIDYVDKFTLFPDKMQEIEPSTFGVDLEEMDFNYLKRKFSYMGSFTQTIAQGPNTVLGQFSMTPCPVPMWTTTATFLPRKNPVPLLQYVSYPFGYWKGGLTYKLQVVASTFHVTKIFVAVQYGNYSSAATGSYPIDDAASQYGYAFEVNQGATEFEFTVPYVSAYSQLHMPYGALDNDKTSMGTIYIVVLNQLANSNNVVDNITYNLYLAGAADYAVSSLSGTANSLYPNVAAVPNLLGESVLSSPMSNTSIAVDDNVISPATLSVARVDMHDKSIESLSQVLKKYHHILSGSVNLTPSNSTTYSTGANATLYFDVVDVLRGATPGASSLPYANIEFGNLFGYISSLYAGFRGPLRFKIVLKSAQIGMTTKVRYYPSTVSQESFGSYQSAISLIPDGTSATPYSTLVRDKRHFEIANSTQKSLEFEIPFISSQSFILQQPYQTGINAYTTESDLGTLVIDFFNPQVTSLTGTPAAPIPVTTEVEIYAALGDEARFGVFKGVPTIQIACDNTATYNAPPPDAYSLTPTSIFNLTTL